MDLWMSGLVDGTGDLRITIDAVHEDACLEYDRSRSASNWARVFPGNSLTLDLLQLPTAESDGPALDGLGNESAERREDSSILGSVIEGSDALLEVEP